MAASSGRQGTSRCSCHRRDSNPQSLGSEPSAIPFRYDGDRAAGGIRTRTGWPLRPLPLPVGLPRRIGGRIRTVIARGLSPPPLPLGYADKTRQRCTSTTPIGVADEVERSVRTGARQSCSTIDEPAARRFLRVRPELRVAPRLHRTNAREARQRPCRLPANQFRVLVMVIPAVAQRDEHVRRLALGVLIIDERVDDARVVTPGYVRAHAPPAHAASPVRFVPSSASRTLR